MVKTLNELDRKILQTLTDSHGAITSVQIAKQLGVPLSTVQRRRKRVEAEYITSTYGLNVAKFGAQVIDFLISTGGGKTHDIAMALLKLTGVIYAARTIGQHTIDLQVRMIVKGGNIELIDILEKMNAMDGVKGTQWIQPIQVYGSKSPSLQLIEALA